jgi:hypothetical protein
MSSDLRGDSRGASSEATMMKATERAETTPKAESAPLHATAAAPTSPTSSTEYKTVCPRTADGQHAWQLDRERTEFYTVRFVCECGATGWRPRALRGESHTHDRPIREYRPKSSHLKEARQRAADRADPGPKITAQPRRHGRNETGGYLPPGSNGWD